MKPRFASGLFCARWTLTRDLSQVTRFAHPFGAAVKRVLPSSRVQVAEPNLKPRFAPGLFCARWTLTRDLSQVIRFAHPFGAALKRVLLPGNENAPHERGVRMSHSAYCSAASSAVSGVTAAAGGAGFSSSLMASNSRSKTRTELAGINGLGLCSP